MGVNYVRNEGVSLLRILQIREKSQEKSEKWQIKIFGRVWNHPFQRPPPYEKTDFTDKLFSSICWVTF